MLNFWSLIIFVKMNFFKQRLDLWDSEIGNSDVVVLTVVPCFAEAEQFSHSFRTTS